MKLKIILAAISLTAISAAAQDVDLTITGATAFRQSAYRSIYNLFDTSPAPVVKSLSSTDPTNANRSTISGKITSLYGASRNVTIRMSWSGSVQGITDVAQGNLIDTLSPTVNGQTNFFVPTFTFADNLQTSTAITEPTLDLVPVGVVPFAWVKSIHNAADNAGTDVITNITSSMARALLANGKAPRGFFYGNPLDTKDVFAIGRDAGSGTRVITYADTGFGIFRNSSLYATNGGTGAARAFVQTNGYTSGSFVANVLRTPNLVSPAIGYASIADANRVLNGANILTYNGVKYTDDNVRNGQYTFWSFEQFGNLADLADEDALAFRDALVTAVPNNLVNANGTTEGIARSTMKVNRFDDGAEIYPNY